MIFFYENFEPDISNENLVYNLIAEAAYLIEYSFNDYVVLSKLSIQELLEIRTKKLLEEKNYQTCKSCIFIEN